MSRGKTGIKDGAPGLSGNSAAYQHDNVQVPMYPGTYVLQFRWDCEQTSQIWAHCADITIDPVPFNMYQVTVAWDGWKCLNVPDSEELENGHEVNIWDCNGQDDQKWVFDNGQLKYKANPKYCLDIPGGNIQSGQPMWMWECSGSDSQQFGFFDDGYAIYPVKGDNICLDVAGGDYTNANLVQLWECNGAEQQMWIVPDARNYQTGNSCVDLPGGNNKNGQQMWIWECNGAEHQAFVWTNYNMRYGPDLSKCLDLPGGDTTNGKTVWLWDCDGGNNQRWGYNQDTGGIFFADDLSKCLDAGNAGNGAPLMIWDCNQQSQQQWAMPSLINPGQNDVPWEQKWKITNSSFVV